MLPHELQIGDVITAKDGGKWGTVTEIYGGHAFVRHHQPKWWKGDKPPRSLVNISRLDRNEYGKIYFNNGLY